MSEQKPAVGSVVHFVDRQGLCLVALVSTVAKDDELPDRDPVGAIVFNANGTLSPQSAWRTYRGEPGEQNLWHWPSPDCPS